MATQTTTALTAQPVFMFMPDISGFTQFVSNTEIAHAQHIIQDLLEVIIQSNNLGLEVSEIEGDAVFFYRTGLPPRFEEVLQQVQSMFTRFHQHLNFFYVHQRICPCGACAGASDLKLKFFAHYGEVSGISVHNKRRLFGKEVILLHRLMKNNLNKKEYILLTDPLLQGVQQALPHPAWYSPEEALEQYDVGEVRFKVSDLSTLHTQMPPMPSPVQELYKNTVTSFSEERVIESAMAEVFLSVFDLTQRPRWMEGVKAVEMITKDSVNRVGTKHRCVLGGKNDPIIVTEKIQTGDQEMELVEMDEKGMGGCRFIMQKIDAGHTRIQAHILVRNSFAVKAIFSLVMKARMKLKISRSLDNLQLFCKQAKGVQASSVALN